jgi:hypothetical protein
MSLSFVITDADGTALEDISTVTSGKTVTRNLNLPWHATGKVQSHRAGNIQPGNRLKVYLDGTIFFNGMLWMIEDDGDADTIYTQFTAVDPMILWPSRPARDDTGDFSKPTFLTDYLSGPQIMEDILLNSESNGGGGPPSFAEGTTFLNFAGTVETGGVDLSGAPTDWPMTIMDVFTLLSDTGELDVVLSPIDTTDGTMCSFNAYNGNYGVDRTGLVSLEFATGARNVRAMKRSTDLSTLCNKLWYYLGPRVGTSTDPAGNQHWRGNVTGDGYPDGTGTGTPLPNPPGGDIDFPNPLGDLINASRTKYGVFMDVRIFDSDGATGVADPLYARLWQTEEKLRINGRTMVNATPVRGTAPSFDIGDLISVSAGSSFRGGFSGTQRIYGYTVEEDDDGVIGVTNIACSADQEQA